MSQTHRALLCVVAYFVLCYLCWRLARWCNRRGKVAQLFATVLTWVCEVFVPFGVAALIAIGLETGFIAQAYHLARSKLHYSLMASALLALIAYLAVRQLSRSEDSHEGGTTS